MNCAEFESLVEALARGEAMEESARRSTLLHAAECPACNRQLERARALTAGLRSMARTLREESTPAGVELRLMEAFDRRGAVVSRGRIGAWVAAVASLFALGVALTTLAPGPATVAQGVSAVAAEALAAGDEFGEEIATEFFPLQADVDLEEETGGLVRLSVPRTALLAFGLPMNDERAFEPLEAEILVGEDGAARAIRFLNERP